MQISILVLSVDLVIHTVPSVMMMIQLVWHLYQISRGMYMLGAKHGFGQSMDGTAQSVDPSFARTIHALFHE